MSLTSCMSAPLIDSEATACACDKRRGQSADETAGNIPGGSNAIAAAEPDKPTTVGDGFALCEKVSVPETGPARAEENEMSTLQLVPCAIDAPATQVPPAILKAMESLVIDARASAALPEFVSVTCCAALPLPTTDVNVTDEVDTTAAAAGAGAGAGGAAAAGVLELLPPPPHAARAVTATAANKLLNCFRFDWFIFILIFSLGWYE